METREIRLTAGNIRNNYIDLTDVIGLFPKEVIGGNNKKNMGKRVLVKTDNGLQFHTDIAGDKKIFRARGVIKRFFNRSRLEEGDIVAISKISDYEYFLAKKQNE